MEFLSETGAGLPPSLRGLDSHGQWNRDAGEAHSRYIVTWAIGHLAALAQPHEIDPAWRQWRRSLLPMLPRQWPLVVYEKTKDQFDTVKRILNSPKVARIVCATDSSTSGAVPASAPMMSGSGAVTVMRPGER